MEQRIETSSPVTVRFTILSPKLNVVLYSEQYKCWKIADFGTASSATSKRLNTTRYSRGTAGYRAPEILVRDPKYSNKVDIFALGCIIYELVTGERLFYDDVATASYGRSGLIGATQWPEADGDLTKAQLLFFEKQVASMLELDPSKRPNSRDLVGLEVNYSDSPIFSKADSGPLQVYFLLVGSEIAFS